MPKNLRVGSRPRGVNFYTVKDDDEAADFRFSLFQEW